VTGLWSRVRRHHGAAPGIALAALVLAAAVLAPALAPNDPNAVLDAVHGQLLSPSLHHLLGTDALSRDVLSRLLFGARVSLAVGLTSSLLAALLGTLVGLAAGVGGARLDGALMRGVDVLLALPRVFLLMTAFALWEGVGFWAMVALIGATGWFETSRLVRAHVRELRNADFVTAALALGGGRRRMVRHLLPHVAATAIVSATLDVGGVILLEAGLSFLGLGLRPPTATWGNMILEGRDVIFAAPWVALAPGVALTTTVIAFNLLGDALRDALDPRGVR
jgi:peptide/nickel transport system permease protein